MSFVARLFFLLAAGLVWITNPPEAATSLVIAIFGPDAPTWVKGFATGILIAFVLLAMEWLFDRFVVRFILPWTGGFRGGIWLYALVPKGSTAPERHRATVGVFCVKLQDGQYYISHGQAYIIRDSKLVRRGTLHSLTVTAEKKELHIVYVLTAAADYNQDAPDVEGYMRLRDCETLGLIGREFQGRFNDLKDRGHVHGRVYAEHVSRSLKWKEYHRVLEARYKEFLERLIAQSSSEQPG
jgi:hypothetical protein